ncbi:MAG: TonB family protein [Pyrinomonadaceae bacterium]
MKKILFLTAMFCLLAISASAQNKTDFSGDWELDTVQSKMDERMRVESMTMKVQQTEKDITVGTFTKRAVSNEGGMNRGGTTPTALTYSLEGKKTKAEVGGGMMAGTATLKASLGADGKLNLSSVRNINTQMGAMTITVNETWELADGGKTLKVTRNMETPRGAQNSELVFAKKDSASVSAETPKIDTAVTNSAKLPTPKTISGGVLNSKAKNLAKPVYPEAARAVKASGAVNVQVTIDEQGNVISASAVSGHPLLRKASEDAARASKFSPTMLEGVPVKVTGIVIYNFVP